MNAYTHPRLWIVLGVAIVSLLLAQQFWHWEIERIEVAPEKFLVRVHRWGTDLPEDQIVAPDESYKGVMFDVLPEGRHFLNPIVWGYEIHDMVHVPPGKCLVLTSKYGADIPRDRLERGEILANNGERGIVEKVLPPGSYRLNPYAYSWELVKAVEVGIDQVGVRTLKVGKDPRVLPPDPRRSPYVVPAGYRGVQQTPEQSGTYYLNPYVATITPVEVRSHRVELTDIEFPSRDGFILKPHVFVEYRVQPEKAPEMLVRLTDEGILHQEDATEAQQHQNEILQKVILPHIRGYARIEGSNFDARDFILTAIGPGKEKVVNNRERLQRALVDKVKPRCQELGIDVRAVTLANLKPPAELTEQISQRDLALRKQETNRKMVDRYKEEQKLMATQTRSDQAKEVVDAKTGLVTEQTKAEQRKKVEELKLKQELESAHLRLEAARLQAQATLTNGKAEAQVITAQNAAEVAGLSKAVKGFGSANYFAQYHMLMRLAPTLREIFASDDSEFAKLFSAYMTPSPATTPKPAAGSAAGAAGKTGPVGNGQR